MDILIKNIGLPTEDEQINLTILSDGTVIEHFRNESGKWSSYRSGGVTAIELPPHGRLIDADELLASDAIGWGEEAWNGINHAPVILEENYE